MTNKAVAQQKCARFEHAVFVERKAIKTVILRNNSEYDRITFEQSILIKPQQAVSIALKRVKFWCE